MALRLRRVFEPQLESHELSRLLDGVELPLIDVLSREQQCHSSNQGISARMRETQQ